MPSRAFTTSSGATGQYLIGTAPFDNNMTTYTLTAWVYPTAIPNFANAAYFPVIWKGSDNTGPRDLQGPSMSIYSDVNGNLQLWCTQTYATSDATVFTALTGQLPLNAWSLISFVVTPTATHAYVNGVEVVYDAGSPTVASGAIDDDSAHPWTISVDDPGNVISSSFVGQISDTRIYTRALSSAELLQLTSFTNPSASGLSAEWPMCGNNPEVDIVGGHSLTVHLASISVNQPHQFCTGSALSIPDCRNFSVFPNNANNVNGTLIYEVPAHPSTTPPADSRTSGAPVDSRQAANVPQNSRTGN